MTEYEKAMMELKNAFGSESMWNVPLPALMSPEEEAAYRANNFVKQDEIRKRIEEEESAKRAAQSGSGLFGAIPSSSGFNDAMPENPIAKREADLLAKGIAPEVVAEIMRAEQEERGSRLAASLNLFANAFMPGMTAMGLSKYGPEGYSDYIRGNTGVMMGNANGYIPTHRMGGVMTAEQMMASDRAAKEQRDMIARSILAQEAQNRAMTQASRTYGGFDKVGDGTYLTSYGPTVSTSGMSPETRSGLEAAQASFGYGTDADYYGD